MLRRCFKACRTTSCYLVISFDLVWQMSRFAGVAWPAARPHLTACAHVPGSMALRVLTFAGTWQINLASKFDFAAGDAESAVRHVDGGWAHLWDVLALSADPLAQSPA